jgi:hypothetical protein
MTHTLPRRVAAEFVGTGFLVAAVVGSGIMGERLAAGNVAIALLANTIATGGALLALILTFGPISGAHLNPAVTLVYAIEHGVSWAVAAGYAIAQCGASNVRPTRDFVVPSCAGRVGAGIGRICGDLRPAVRNLGLFAPTVRSRAVRRGGLHHGRVLVHFLNVVFEPSGHSGPVTLRHLGRNSPG